MSWQESKYPAEVVLIVSDRVPYCATIIRLCLDCALRERGLQESYTIMAFEIRSEINPTTCIDKRSNTIEVFSELGFDIEKIEVDIYGLLKEDHVKKASMIFAVNSASLGSFMEHFPSYGYNARIFGEMDVKGLMSASAEISDGCLYTIGLDSYRRLIKLILSVAINQLDVIFCTITMLSGLKKTTKTDKRR